LVNKNNAYFISFIGAQPSNLPGADHNRIFNAEREKEEILP